GARARAIVTGIFRLMPTQFNRRAARDLRAAIEWRVTEADGGASIHTVRISGGRCRVRRGVVADPDLVLSLDTADFLRLAAGAARVQAAHAVEADHARPPGLVGHPEPARVGVEGPARVVASNPGRIHAREEAQLLVLDPPGGVDDGLVVGSGSRRGGRRGRVEV